MATARILIVGAGAAGGYIGAQLMNAGRDVTFLVHARSLQALSCDGLRIREGREMRTTAVKALTTADLRDTYDVIILAVRTNAVTSAIDDIRVAVGTDTRIVPVMNGMKHLAPLTHAFGPERVLGAATRLIASMSRDGVIDVVTPGIEMQIGQLDGTETEALRRTVSALGVANVDVTVRSDVIAAMWEKFAFITSTAVITCLVGDEIGPIVRADGGVGSARSVLAEVSAIAAASGYPLSPAARAGIEAILTDASSTFGPSMFRDMRAGRPVEISVLTDLRDIARTHAVSTPLLDASIVVIDVHNQRMVQPAGQVPDASRSTAAEGASTGSA